jgi:hypothetical protein
MASSASKVPSNAPAAATTATTGSETDKAQYATK